MRVKEAVPDIEPWPEIVRSKVHWPMRRSKRWLGIADVFFQRRTA
jgi:hypothetical protein